MDITTLAAANAYTNKKVAEGGGGAKVIDLSSYIYASDGLSTTLGNMVLMGFVAGGGIQTFDNLFHQFWEDVNTDKPLKLILDANALESGAIIEFAPVAIIRQNGAVSSVQTTTLLLMNGAITRSTMLFQLNPYRDKMYIVVALEQLTVPNS